jgi:hypothetical protein
MPASRFSLPPAPALLLLLPAHSRFLVRPQLLTRA